MWPPPEAGEEARVCLSLGVAEEAWAGAERKT